MSSQSRCLRLVLRSGTMLASMHLAAQEGAIVLKGLAVGILGSVKDQVFLLEPLIWVVTATTHRRGIPSQGNAPLGLKRRLTRIFG